MTPTFKLYLPDFESTYEFTVRKDRPDAPYRGICYNYNTDTLLPITIELSLEKNNDYWKVIEVITIARLTDKGIRKLKQSKLYEDSDTALMIHKDLRLKYLEYKIRDTSAALQKLLSDYKEAKKISIGN